MQNTENPKYIWLYRKVTNSELEDHRIYKAVPYVDGGKIRKGGWLYVTEPVGSVRWRKEYQRRLAREQEKREQSSQ
tara:strand:+ start:316 stop:543 length:228 start_codon:yes stop_codon:yes gene_type:complete